MKSGAVDKHVPVIRAARPGDAEALAALLRELGYPTTATGLQQRLAELAGETRLAVFVAESAGTPIGLATAHIIRVVHSDNPVAVLSALVVAEGYRRKGVGRGLADAVAAWAQGRDAYRITVASGLVRNEAHAFYERMGYEHTARRYSRAL